MYKRQVLVTPDSDRTLCTFLGISGGLSKKELVEDALLDSEYFYMEGYLVTSETAREACIAAKRLAEAVSYTHLDVYKRQPFHQPVQGFAQQAQAGHHNQTADPQRQKRINRRPAGEGNDEAGQQGGHRAEQVAQNVQQPATTLNRPCKPVSGSRPAPCRSLNTTPSRWKPNGAGNC